MNFTSTLKESYSVSKTLRDVARTKKIDAKLLDFELISHQTYIKTEDSTEYKLLDELDSLSKTDFVDENLEIKQKYSIKIFLKQKKEQTLKVKLSANKLKTKITLTIEKGSIFSSELELHRQIKDLIWHEELKYGLYINIFESFLDEQLDKLINLVPKDKAIKKDIKMTVGLGTNPSPAIDPKIQKIYIEKHKDEHNLVEGVDVDELIFIYFKEKEGTNGRSCDGKIIIVPEPIIIDNVPTIDETIELLETQDEIKYFAKINGFVSLHDNNFSISNQLTIDSDDLKPTSNLNVGEEKDISVNVQHTKSYTEDAINSGTNIDVKKLDVDGSVGANVNIHTQELYVDAQTHKRATIEVENNANIKLHRGDLTANDAEIDMLESGKVTAHNSIYIKKMLGGIAMAPVVIVDELLSNCTIVASKSIEIKTISGQNISLKIDPASIESYHEDLEDLQINIKEYIVDILEIKKQYEDDLKEHDSKIDRIKTFQMRVAKAIKEGKKPMRQDTLRVEDYQRNSQKLEDTNIEIQAKEVTLDEMQNTVKDMLEMDLHATITSQSDYDGHQNVVFVNPKNKEKIESKPNGRVDTISLILGSDNQRMIKLD